MSSKLRWIPVALAILALPRGASAQPQQRPPLQIAVDPNAPRQPQPAPLQEVAVGEPCRPELGCWAHIIAALDLHLLRTHAGDQRLRDEVAGFTEQAELVMTKDGMAGEVLYDVLFGGGTSGLELRGGLQLAFGTRLDVARGQGVYGRGGFKLFGMKNNHLGFGEVSLPKADIGYQYMRGNTLAELGGDIALAMASELAVGSAVPWGVHQAGDTEASDFARNKSTYRPSWGAHAVFRNAFLGLRTHFTRIEAGAEGPGPIDSVQSILCGFPSSLALCTDVRHLRARALESRPEGAREVEASAWMVGLTVGAGLIPQ